MTDINRGDFVQWVTEALRAHKQRKPMPGDRGSDTTSKRRVRAPALVPAQPVDDGRPCNPLVKMAYTAMQAGHLPIAAKVLRTLHDIEIEKIAAVTKPAQQLATARLIKSDNSKEPPMNINKLEADIDSLLAKIDKALALDDFGKRKQKMTHHHVQTYDDGYDDVSNPAVHLDGEDGDDEELEDDADEEEDGEDVQKASINEYLRTHSTTDRPGALSSSTHKPNRHKFDALRDKIKNDRGVPATTAAHMARTEFPDVFADYQDHGKQIYNKRAPTTYEDMVEAEMAKGCNRVTAGQRVLHAYGTSLPHRNISKAAVAQHDFDERAQDIYQDDTSLTRCEAMRKARLDNPGLYKRMQRV
jgi:hypothetical protein